MKLHDLKIGDRILPVGVIATDWREAGIASVYVTAMRPELRDCRVCITSVYGGMHHETWNLSHVLSSIPRFYRIERPDTDSRPDLGASFG